MEPWIAVDACVAIWDDRAVRVEKNLGISCNDCAKNGGI